ncbi:N-acetyl-gamma-glutamyl-phosphate reductase [Frankliniella fusca]|uniref:N-acetyl-gamma-glutamyl-phosphate reductase n=1 Tax=Frankliniella fusca TaxID=407009 RepID=A0AAE1HG76_9NEOP|nr:N-acetyl-gamma-glutamyl-phosphate reductase [Frankliniella fusca]
MKTTSDPAIIEQCKNYRRFYKSEIVKMKKQLNADNIEKATNKSKAMWSIINKETGREAKGHTNIEILDGDQELKNPSEVANAFNSYFINSVQSLVSEPDGSAEQNVSRSCNSIAFTPVTELDIKNIIRKMKAKTSAGVDGIPSTIVKETAHQILKPLTFIINASMESGLAKSLLRKDSFAYEPPAVLRIAKNFDT